MSIAFAPGLPRAALTLMDVGADGKVAAVIHEARRTSGEWSSPARVAFSADGRLRIWGSARAGGLGRTDLCFSRLDHAGNWTPARNLTVRED